MILLQDTEYRSSVVVISAILVSHIYIYISHFIRHNKYYFIIEKGSIRWKMLAMEEEYKIELTGQISDITADWKGIYFKNNEVQHCIMSDGLTKKQKNIIIEGLKDYSSLLS